MSANAHNSQDDNALARAALLANPTTSHLTVPGQSPYSSTSSSRFGSETSLHRIKNVPGYTTPVFSEKEQQKATVEKNIVSKVSAVHGTAVSGIAAR